MTWQILLFIALIFSSVAVIVQKTIHNLNRSNPVTFSIAFQLTTGFMILIYGIINKQHYFGNLDEIWANLVIMSLLYGFGNALYFLGLKLTEASIYTIICSSSTIFAIIGSGLFLKQYLSHAQLLGAGLICGSVLLANNSHFKLKITKGVMVTLLGAVFMGFALVNDKFVIDRFNIYSYLSLAFIFPALLMIIVFKPRMVDLIAFVKPEIRGRFFLFCIAFMAQVIFYFSAFKLSTNSSQFVSIAMFGTVITLILSIVFLKERNNLITKFVSIGLGVSGLFLLK